MMSWFGIQKLAKFSKTVSVPVVTKVNAVIPVLSMINDTVPVVSVTGISRA